MATLIIYYSQSGKTELVAHTLAKNLRANVLRIQDLKNRNGFKNKFIASISAFRESKTDITPARVDLTDYDTIIFGTPTWAGNPTPAILTIIDRCNLTGKDVILFATMDGSRGDTNIERLEEKVKMRGARVIESFTIATKDKDSEKLITDTEAVIEMKDLKMYTR
ncbi:MAG: NAD(P)H-dependent oxidoreductase [archaeon]|uniref:Flavodoxin n=1 Tax=Methanobrevibacter gottschalkii DSM 11977 TaxID=1122229 RepID=A0A3N5B7N8_9EURY|nr:MULTISPECIES: flavodoxin domain-containing protein [Methanobrevibacter]MCQ2970959.1 NAD(P)H-dependent oxidoreductase [archaeon]OEC98521.1 flavodoxin [Methanobrevibacter sp. A27]RPF51500.1 flavodoxin [Methanobrevibacter gottschalkii DSM 11977]